MIIAGKHVPNISCKRCHFRHPELLSCAQARALVEANRSERAAEAAISGDAPQTATDVLNARFELRSELSDVIRGAGYYTTRDQSYEIAAAVVEYLRERGHVV